MKKPNVEIRVMLTSPMADALEQAAKEYDLTVGAVIREALAHFLTIEEAGKAFSGAGNCNPPNSEKDRCMDFFSSAVRDSSNWQELQKRLLEANLEVAAKGGGIIVRSAETKDVLFKASEAGYGYSSLIKRFRSGFPGHGHNWLANRVLGEGDSTVFEE